MDKVRRRETYKAASAAILGLLIASLVLLPSAFGVIRPPYQHFWALWLYLVFLIVSSILLSAAYYLASWTTKNPPDKTGSLGVVAALISLLFFTIFIFGNMRSDQISPPEVSSLTADKFIVAPGGFVALTAEATDQSGDVLRWTWTVRRIKDKAAHVSQLRSTIRSAAWHVPADVPAGDYEIRASASDGGQEGSASLIVWVEEKCGG